MVFIVNPYNFNLTINKMNSIKEKFIPFNLKCNNYLN